MIKVGDVVKVEDIGTLALCTGVVDSEVKLKLDGEEFWIINSLCHEIEDVA